MNLKVGGVHRGQVLVGGRVQLELELRGQAELFLQELPGGLAFPLARLQAPHVLGLM